MILKWNWKEDNEVALGQTKLFEDGELFLFILSKIIRYVFLDYISNSCTSTKKKMNEIYARIIIIITVLRKDAHVKYILPYLG